MTTSKMLRRGSVPRFIRLQILVLGLSVVGVLLFFTTEVEAILCKAGYRDIAGYCIRTSSVATDVEVIDTGTQRNPKRFRTDVTAVPGDNGLVEIFVFCGNKANKGSKHPVGQAKVVIPQSVTDFCDEPVQITSPKFGGTGAATCVAWDEADFLANFDMFCSTGQFALAVVPIDIVARLNYYDADDGQANPKETFDAFCTLPNPENFGWDKARFGPESRIYDCITGPEL